jgi:hypothetical protein
MMGRFAAVALVLALAMAGCRTPMSRVDDPTDSWAQPAIEPPAPVVAPAVPGVEIPSEPMDDSGLAGGAGAFPDLPEIEIGGAIGSGGAPVAPSAPLTGGSVPLHEGAGDRYPAAPSDPFARVSEALAASLEAHAVWVVPDTLYRGDSERVTLALSLEDFATAAREAGAPGGDAPGALVDSAIVRVLSRVRARLISSSDGLEVKPITNSVARIGYNSPARWAWSITAQKEGKYQVHLDVASLYSLGGREDADSAQPLERTIQVLVRPGDERRERFQVLAAWIGDNVEWLWTALVIPLGTAVWTRWRRRRTGPASPAS